MERVREGEREVMKGDLQGANETTKGCISYLFSESVRESCKRRTDQLAARTHATSCPCALT